MAEEQSESQGLGLAQFRQKMREVWSREAECWRKWYPQNRVRLRAATDALIAAAKISPGMRVLDVASGSGDPAIPIAKIVGEKGHVVATDLVQEMLDVARENARKEGLTNISFEQAEAEELPFPDDHFDAITCRFGVMFFPDVQRALLEMRRVLKPNGSIALMAWGPKERNESWVSTVSVVIKYLRLPSRESGSPDPYRFAESGKLWSAMVDSKFSRVVEEHLTVEMPWEGTPELAWEQFCDTWKPLGAFDGVDQLTLEKIRTEVLERMRKYYDGSRMITRAPLVIGKATKWK